jgi:hypothetical protein
MKRTSLKLVKKNLLLLLIFILKFSNFRRQNNSLIYKSAFCFDVKEFLLAKGLNILIINLKDWLKFIIYPQYWKLVIILNQRGNHMSKVGLQISYKYLSL